MFYWSIQKIPSPPSLRLVPFVNHSVFPVTVTWRVGGTEMEFPAKKGRGVEGRKGSGWQKKRSQARDLFRPRDMSGAGRGRNWEWHSWLELPNCHFLSSLFTHSRSLSRTFEERRTDMCLLVQPSLLTVITVVHEHSISIQHPSAWHRRINGEQEGNGALT